MKSREILIAVKQQNKLASFNKLAALLDIPQGRIAQVYTKSRKIDDAMAIKLAAHSNFDAEYIMFCVQAERAKAPAARRIWQNLARTAKRAHGFVVLLAITTMLSGLAPQSVDASANADEHNVVTIYTLYAYVCRWLRWFAAIGSGFATSRPRRCHLVSAR